MRAFSIMCKVTQIAYFTERKTISTQLPLVIHIFSTLKKDVSHDDKKSIIYIFSLL